MNSKMVVIVTMLVFLSGISSIADEKYTDRIRTRIEKPYPNPSGWSYQIFRYRISEISDKEGWILKEINANGWKVLQMEILEGKSILLLCAKQDQTAGKVINEKKVQALQQLVNLHVQKLERLQAQQQTGLAVESAVRDARIALSEAKLRLATAEKNSDKAIQELKQIVHLRKQQLEELQAKAASGMVSPDKIEMAKIQLLEAQIRLTEAKD